MQGLRTGAFRHGQPLGDEPQKRATRALELTRGKAAQALQIVERAWGFAGDFHEQFIVQHTARRPVALAGFTITPDGQLPEDGQPLGGERVAAPYAAKEFLRITLIQRRVGEFAAFFGQPGRAPHRFQALPQGVMQGQ